MVKDATGQSLADDGRGACADAATPQVATMDEAPRTASNIAEQPTFLGDKSPTA